MILMNSQANLPKNGQDYHPPQTDCQRPCGTAFQKTNFRPGIVIRYAMRTTYFHPVIACLSLSTGFLHSQENPMKEPPRAAVERPMREAGERLMQTPQKPWRIGLMVNAVDDTLRSHLDLPENSAVIVTECREGEPAHKSGIRKNDVIVSVNGRPAGSIAPLAAAVEATARTGEPLRLGILHKGQRREVMIKPDLPKPMPERDMADRTPKERPIAPDMPAMMRMQEQMMRRFAEQQSQWTGRLERQEKELMRLRQEVEELNKALRQMKSESKEKEKN